MYEEYPQTSVTYFPTFTATQWLPAPASREIYLPYRSDGCKVQTSGFIALRLAQEDPKDVWTKLRSTDMYLLYILACFEKCDVLE